MRIRYHLTRMSKRQRDRMWYHVAYREAILGLPLVNLGEYCRGCGIAVSRDGLGAIPQGLIDCVPNDGDHSDIRKLQLLCRACNGIKNPRVPEIPRFLEMSYSMAKNLKTEPLWRAYVVNKLSEHGGSYDAGELIAGGAEKYGCGIKTASNYMRKFASAEGPGHIENGILYWDDGQSMDAWFAEHEDELAEARAGFLRSKGLGA